MVDMDKAMGQVRGPSMLLLLLLLLLLLMLLLLLPISISRVFPLFATSSTPPPVTSSLRCC